MVGLLRWLSCRRRTRDLPGEHGLFSSVLSFRKAVMVTQAQPQPLRLQVRPQDERHGSAALGEPRRISGC